MLQLMSTPELKRSSANDPRGECCYSGNEFARTVVVKRPKPPFASLCLNRLDVIVDPWIRYSAALMGDLKSLQKRHTYEPESSQCQRDHILGSWNDWFSLSYK